MQRATNEKNKARKFIDALKTLLSTYPHLIAWCIILTILIATVIIPFYGIAHSYCVSLCKHYMQANCDEVCDYTMIVGYILLAILVTYAIYALVVNPLPPPPENI